MLAWMRVSAQWGYGRDGSGSLIFTGSEAHGTGKRGPSARGTTSRRRLPTTGRRFAVCVRSKGYESLERNKIDAVLSDREAEREGASALSTSAASAICSRLIGSLRFSCLPL